MRKSWLPDAARRLAMAILVLGMVLVWATVWTPHPATASSTSATPGDCGRAQDVRGDIARIDRSGARPGTVNLSLNTELLMLAKCYTRSGNRELADIVVEGLLKYAEVVRSWPVLDSNGKPQALVDHTYWDLRGHWGGQWVFTDLRPTGDLARAFELVAGSGALAASDHKHGHDSARIIKEQLLRFLVDFNLRFGRGKRVGTVPGEAVFPFHNMDPARLEELVVLGRTVDPAYIHIAVRFLRAFPTVGFFRDGFWHEGTISYHRQVVEALDSVVAALRGYTDPVGYVHAGYVTMFGDRYDGVAGRFDNLDPLAEMGEVYSRIRAAERPFTLPDRRMLAKNETHASDRGDARHAPTRSQCLLGLRHCVLVQGKEASRNILHLDFGGTDGHEHLDALHIDYWAGGRLLASDGDYSKHSPRAFNMSTAAHNTVVVDGANQNGRFANRRTLTPADAVAGLGFSLWQGYGQGDTDNQGDLLAAGLAEGPVAYVSADAARAYAGAANVQRYQRTVALIKGESNESYAVDVFRIVGGRRHEWMLHGDLASTYEAPTSLQESKSKTARGYFSIVRSAKTGDKNWVSAFVYDDATRLRTHHVQTTAGEAHIALAPAQVRPGTAPYLIVAQPGVHGLFVKIHVAEGARPSIQHVRLLQPARTADAPLRLRITMATGRIDELTLRAGWNEQVDIGSRIVHEARTRSGRCLWRYEGDIETPIRSWRTDGILGISRRAAGDRADGVRLARAIEDFPVRPEAIHLRLPNQVVESFVVKSMETAADGEVFFETEGDPGLAITPVQQPSGGKPAWHVKYLYYPSSGLQGTLEVRTTTNRQLDCAR